MSWTLHLRANNSVEEQNGSDIHHQKRASITCTGPTDKAVGFQITFSQEVAVDLKNKPQNTDFQFP